MDFIVDPSLVLDLPLYELDGASFASRDAYRHPCTVTGALWTPRGRSFDGSDDYINGGASPSFPSNGLDFTVIAWIKTLSSTRQGLVSRYAGSLASWFLELTANGLARFVIFNSTGNAYADAADTANTADGHWHQLAGVWKVDIRADLFVDSRLAATDTSFSGTKSGHTPNLHIGKHEDARASGLIGEVWLFRRALPLMEIQRNYLATKWRYR